MTAWINPGDRGPPSVLDVGRGPRDGPRRGDAPEERGDDVGEPLRDQLHVGTVTPSGHPVRDDRAEQGLDPAEQRDRQRRGDQSGSIPSRHRGKAGRRSVEGTAPNRSPIVSTGRSNSRTTTVAATRATSEPGTRRSTRGQSAMIATVPTVTPSAAGFERAECRA